MHDDHVVGIPLVQRLYWLEKLCVFFGFTLFAWHLLIKVKGKVKVSYFTSVAKQAKTAFLHGLTV